VAIVVSDTSPIRALHQIGQLSLLEYLFGDVLIPPAVMEELAAPRRNFPPLDGGKTSVSEGAGPEQSIRRIDAASKA
jgi:hypothetical protein